MKLSKSSTSYVDSSLLVSRSSKPIPSSSSVPSSMELDEDAPITFSRSKKKQKTLASNSHPFSLIDEDTDDEFDNIIEDNAIHISDTIEEGTDGEDGIGLEDLETNSDKSTYEVDDLDNFIDDEDATSHDTDDKNNDNDLFFNDDAKKLMRSRGTTLRHWPEVPYPDERYITKFGNRLIYDETDYNPVELQSEYEHSGTTLTFIDRELYEELTSGLTEVLGSPTAQDPHGFFEYCHTDLNMDTVPTVTFRFTGGDVELPPENTFSDVQKGITCLTIVPSTDIAIFGNLAQRNLLVGYDLVNNEVSFKPADCVKH
ncbi:Aspartic peptidase [Artemisia annua]|uniref:Aspartic peptidase n=1 Tax=Artemisia annua TaxID=35608 RepID=A0A2U1QB81_ARTAN|nr:Aspartic peptidase [Artemisia annua]